MASDRLRLRDRVVTGDSSAFSSTGVLVDAAGEGGTILRDNLGRPRPRLTGVLSVS